MKEKIKKNWRWMKWILIAVIIYAAIYLIYPKYYFISSSEGVLRYRCNKITGQCERRNSSWVKQNNNKTRENNVLEKLDKEYKELFPAKEK